jgi:hypothetical protein
LGSKISQTKLIYNKIHPTIQIHIKEIWNVEEENLGQLSNYRTFCQKKLSLGSQKYGFAIRKKPIPDPGVKKAPDPGSATLNGREGN